MSHVSEFLVIFLHFSVCRRLDRELDYGILITVIASLKILSTKKNTQVEKEIFEKLLEVAENTPDREVQRELLRAFGDWHPKANLATPPLTLLQRSFSSQLHSSDVIIRAEALRTLLQHGGCGPEVERMIQAQKLLIPSVKGVDNSLPLVGQLSQMIQKSEARHHIYCLALCAMLYTHHNGNKYGCVGNYPLRSQQQDPHTHFHNNRDLPTYQLLKGDYKGHNIAAIAVDKNGEIITHAFNHMYVFESTREHAEERLVDTLCTFAHILMRETDKAKFSTRLKDVTIYTSLEPCHQCAGKLAAKKTFAVHCL